MTAQTTRRLTVDQVDAIFAASPYYHDLDDDDPEDFDGDDSGILYPLRDGSAVRVDWSGDLTFLPADGDTPEGTRRLAITDKIEAMASANLAAYLERNPLG
jgi:hypothetical protein